MLQGPSRLGMYALVAILAAFVSMNLVFLSLPKADAAAQNFDFKVSNIQFSGSGGRNVTYTVDVSHDNNPVQAECTPASGSIFAPGDSQVTCYVSDSQNNVTSMMSFIITTEGGDIIPPTITAPSNVTLTSQGYYTQVSLGTPTVSDDTDPSPTVTNDAPSQGFQIGETIITWTATDDSGNSATAIQKVTILQNTEPLVSILSPNHGDNIFAGIVQVGGWASSGNPIDRVELTIDGSFAGYRLAMPVSPENWTRWAINYDIPAGSHWLLARVTDNAGKQDWNSITVNAIVPSDTTPPTVTITSPSNNAQVTAGTVKVTGTASDNPGGSGVNRVELTIDGNLAGYQLATPASSGNWSTWSIDYDIPLGQHTLTARVTDNHGNPELDSVMVNAIPDPNTPPTVTITSPSNNAQVTAGTVRVSGTASSGNPIDRVELTIDGSFAGYRLATPRSPDDWSTWSINYDIPAGSHWLTARVTDSAGRQDWHSVTVNALGSDNTDPLVEITSPSNNAQVNTGMVTVSGTASDNPGGSGVNRVELTIDGSFAGYQLATPASSGNWSTWSIDYNVTSGSHWLLARVTDNAGRQDWHSVTVNAITAAAPPIVTITSPSNNAQVTVGTVRVSGTASSGNPIDRVELTIDGSFAGYRLATPRSPDDWSTWSINYDIPAGSHWLLARVTDNAGRQDWNSITVSGQ